VDRLEIDTHKTKDLAGKLAGLGVSGRALLVDLHGNDNLTVAARNNPLVKTVDALAVNVYDVVDRAHIVVSEEALNRIVEVLSK
jgi:large subunit ribosomal protein L4